MSIKELETYFPILNVDYKIASKALAARLCKIIPSLVHSDQSGFVKGIFIGESVRTISDLMISQNFIINQELCYFLIS